MNQNRHIDAMGCLKDNITEAIDKSCDKFGCITFNDILAALEHIKLDIWLEYKQQFEKIIPKNENDDNYA